MKFVQSWMVCIQCHTPANMLFDGNSNYPLCSRRQCEKELIDEINEELIEAAAEVAKEKYVT